MINVTYYEIDEALARTAKSMNSMSTYEENHETESYKKYIDLLHEITIIPLITDLDEVEEKRIEYFFNRYCKKYAELVNKKNRIETMCPSILISGAGNFPVKKKELQNKAREKLFEEIKALNENLHDSINKIASISNKISSDDKDVISKLSAKLEKEIGIHNTLKNANSYYRKHKTLEGIRSAAPNLTDDEIEAARKAIERYKLTTPFYLGYCTQRIEGLKERIASLERLQNREEDGWLFDGGNVVINKDCNRIQLFYNDKPSEEVRTELKRNGFRWAPSVKAWQRMYNNNGLYAAKKVAQPIESKEVETVDIDLF